MYAAKVLTDKPYSFWSLDNADLKDVAGNGHDAEIIEGAWRSANTLVAGGGKSTIVDGDTTIVFNWPLLSPGYENKAWTWELWFHPLDAEGGQILIHDSGMGLSFAGDYLTFTLDYEPAEAVWLQYEMPVREAMHIVIKHTESKVSMYVNSVLVDQKDISFTSFLSEPSNDIKSTAATGSEFLIDSVAFYGYDLSDFKINTHFQLGRLTSLFRDVVQQQAGTYIEFVDANSSLYMSKLWTTDADFATSPSYDCVISNGLKPVDGIDTTWVMPINMSSTIDKLIDYVRVGYRSAGAVVVEISVDGEDWLEVESDIALSLPDLNIKDAVWLIRVTLDGADEDCELTYLDFTVYSDSAINASIRSRAVSYSGVVTIARDINEPIEHNRKRGADLSQGGLIRIGTHTDGDVQNIKTVELWTSFDPAVKFTIVDARTGNTTRPYLAWTGSAWTQQGISKVYVNGTLVDLGTWVPSSNSSYLFTVVFATAGNYELVIGASYSGTYSDNGQVESVAYYDTEPSALKILRMYNSYFGIVTDRITDSTVVVVAENDPAFELYNYVWSVAGG